MDEKQFRTSRMVVAAVLAAVVSGSVLQGNIVLPVIAVVAAAASVLILKSQVADVLVDERVEKVAGAAAKRTLDTGAVVMAAVSVVLIAFRDTLPDYAQAGYTLAYSTCGLLLLYSAFYAHLHRKPG
jgi:uncharacterized membrane protein